jgi:Ni/Co efflux regulator RcnB
MKRMVTAILAAALMAAPVLGAETMPGNATWTSTGARAGKKAHAPKRHARAGHAKKHSSGAASSDTERSVQ